VGQAPKGKFFPFDLTEDNNIEYVASSPTTGTEETPEYVKKYMNESDSNPPTAK
jgi:hypothetical protein